MWVQFVMRAVQTHVPVLNWSSEIHIYFTWLSWTLCLTGQEPWRCCVIFKTSIRSFQLLINRLQPPTYPSFYQRMLLLQISAINCPIKCWKILKCKRYLQHDDDWPGTVQMLILPLFSPPSATQCIPQCFASSRLYRYKYICTLQQPLQIYWQHTGKHILQWCKCILLNCIICWSFPML